MAGDKRHLQLRLTPGMRGELEELSVRYKRSVSDIVRGALFFGLPVFQTMTDLQGDLIKLMVANLKKESRLEN